MTSEPVVRGATEQDFEEIVRMTATAFGDPSSDWPREHTEHDPNHTADLHRICVVDGRIVSAMRIAWHTVHYGSALLKHAGVGDVGTLPDERHHGYSTMVLKDAIAHMQRLGAHFSILYTGIQPFYERLGWAILPIEVPRFAFRQREAAASDARAWVEDFDADRHLEGVRAVYNEFNARKTATTVRESAYWDLRFRRQPRPPLHSVRPDVLVAGQSDAVGAYAIWHARAGVAEVHEYGWRKGCEEPLRTLFAEIDRRGSEQGTELIRCQFGKDYYGRQIAGDVGERPAPLIWKHMMFRVVDLCGLLAAATDELVTRVEPHSGGLCGARLRLCWADQDAIIGVTESAIQVECGSPASSVSSGETLELTSEQLVELIFGRGASLISDAARELDHRSRRLLEVCFPGENLVFWETDGF